MPQSLLSGLTEIGDLVGQAPYVSVFLNFDGTLAPIVEDPSEAQMEEPTRLALKSLSERPDTSTVIVSGRALSDLQVRVGIGDVVYAGNHGLEISGKGLQFVEPFAAARRDLLARVSESLAANLRGIFGVQVEYKGLTTSIHYRQAPATSMRSIEKIVETVVAPGMSPFYLDVGKMVLEVLPRSDWHKGAAVCWINSRLGGKRALSIYVGDDRTDEGTFQRLSEEITVCVGNPEWSFAKYYVSDLDGLREFLGWLKENRNAAEYG